MREVEHNKHAFTAWCVLLPLGDAQNIFSRVQKISRHCRTLIFSHRNTQVWFHGTLEGQNHMCRRRWGWPQMSLQGACDVSSKLWKSTTESVLNGEQHESASMCRSLDEVVRVLNSAQYCRSAASCRHNGGALLLGLGDVQCVFISGCLKQSHT